MYVPKPFAVQNPAELAAFIEREPFGILVSNVEGKPFATHAPFIVSAQGQSLTLSLHVAKANPQWRSLQDAEVLAIFQGAHAFISAGWYPHPQRNVPTWNYGAVHCTGRARLTDGAGTASILERLVERFESSWRMDTADAQYVEGLQQAVVGIEIAVESVSGAFKYLQNHPPEDREAVIAQLERSVRPMDHEVAELMRATLR